MSEELAARLMARIAVPPMPFAPDTYTAGRMDQFTEMITQLRALPEVDKEQVLADVKARIEGALVDLTDRHDDDPYLKGYRIARRDALAALTQPQAEQWHENDEADKAATAAGVPDGDLVARAMAVFNSHIEAERDLEHGGMICSECGFHLGDLPVLHTTRQDHAFRMAFDATGQQEAVADSQPTPYAKAFRERVCPVPEFPSIRETAHEAIIEGGCCIQCGLPNNSETVLFHSCQAGAPADPTCPNTGHKFSHCDCDLGIEKEES